MPEFLKIIILSVIQGLTEFLPVSSSGHLVLAEHFMSFKAPEGAVFEVILHAGTLAAVIIFYRRKFAALLTGIFSFERASVLYAAWVVLSMIPAGILYALTGSSLEEKYEEPIFVARALIAAGIFMTATVLLKNKQSEQNEKARMSANPIKWYQALAMGVAQAIAMLPGVSRSGSTITMARFFGVRPKDAAEFSFIMSVPVIGGAALLKILKHHNEISAAQSLQYGVGAIVAGIVGIIAIKTFVALLDKGRLWVFGVYCIVVGAVSFVLIVIPFIGVIGSIE